MQIILSSNNPKKIQELQAILEGMEVKSYRTFLENIEIEENGTSFEQNARIKAQRIYQLLPKMQEDFCVLADDSGLCVSALKGMPGIYSARFASIKEGARDIAQGRFQTPQTPCDDTQNNLKLLACLEELKITQSLASFVCVIAVCAQVGGRFYEQGFRGECKGRVCKSPLNPQAFGYDPLFIPEGYTLSLDRIQEKNAISHRFLALQKARHFLTSLKTN
ncbi:non-canonical purine NTP pyrophosphatase [Helicobacter felis]|uniref:HAM1-like protein n=1 Tax=Helicobacter felis (strain ATCC 49179 / CCUG 28539 / NCTC 12436 / CS1) TaxID=936155 RepID=E7ACD9_HELFC|nr:non-canonical purine NTP pyrophosphatase [Helicobacter felis]CBY83026.1 Putative HAM1-like protein [Helicobacter felis ATCC 49179]